MARIRTIKPEFWQDERLGSLSRDVRLLYIGLWNIADDHGRLRGHHAFIKGQVFPYDEDVDVAAMLGELERFGRIVRYQVDGQLFIWIPRFSDHQKMDKRTDSKLPAPTAQKSAEPAQESAPEWKGEEGKGREQGSGRERPPAAPTPPNPISSMGGTPAPAAIIEGAEPDKRKGPVVVIPPSTPPDTWQAEDFWAWAQDVRYRNGYHAEKKPTGRGLQDWFREALLSGATAETLKEAFYVFGETDFWKRKTPAYPFAGFMAQWTDFAGKRANHAA